MIKDNTETVAYDSFGNELVVGDRVVCSIPRYSRSGNNNGVNILCRGTVVELTRKGVKVEITDVQTNTNIKYIENFASHIIGTIQQLKSDKIYKIDNNA